MISSPVLHVYNFKPYISNVWCAFLSISGNHSANYFLSNTKPAGTNVSMVVTLESSIILLTVIFFFVCVGCSADSQLCQPWENIPRFRESMTRMGKWNTTQTSL